MKKIILLVLLSLILPSEALVAEYFETFYDNYLSLNNVPENNREILNFLYEISKNKTSHFENALNCSKDCAEREEIISMIDEEYKDLLENINFELNYTNHCPPNKKELKKLKTTHKKFMRRLKKCYTKTNTM